MGGGRSGCRTSLFGEDRLFDVGDVRVRLVVVDDHVVFREGLRALLARVDEVEIVGEASDTDGAVAVAKQCRPDVILIGPESAG